MLTKAERDIISARTMAKARAERIKQVREQERLWARHKAREYRASVKDHHAELNAQLHDGWVKARDEKQRQLERDYSNAAAGIGRSHRAAHRQAVEDKRMRATKAQKEAQKFDDKLVALERFETALKKEYERLDELESVHFKARDRRNKAEQLAKNVRVAMKETWEKEELKGTHSRRCVTKTLTEGTNNFSTNNFSARRLYRPDAFKMTHFNDIIANADGAARPKAKQKFKEKKDDGPGAPTAYAGDWFPRDAAGAYVVKREQVFSAKLKAEREQKRLEEEREELAEQAKRDRAKELRRSAIAIRYERGDRHKDKESAALDAEIREERKEKIKNIGKKDVTNIDVKAQEEERRAMERDFQFKDINEPAGLASQVESDAKKFDDAKPFEGMFDEKVEEARLGQVLEQGLDPDDPLLKILRMAKEAVPRGAAAERVARYGVVGATMEEIAVIAAGGDQEDESDQDDAVCQPVPFQGPTPPSPRVTALSEDSDSEDEDGYIPSGGAGLPPGESNFYSDAQLDAALAAVSAQNNTPSRFGITEEEYEELAARRSAEELEFVSSALQDDTMNTTGMFSRSADDVDVDDLPDQGGFGSPEERSPRAPGPGPVSESTAVVSTVPGASSSSGTAEEEMRASLAATTRAMDRVTAAAAAAEYNLQAASLLASRDTGTRGRVELPELKPLDAILGALGRQVEALDAAAAAAARAAAEPYAGSFTSSDIISQAEASLEGRTLGGFAYDETVSTEMGDTSAMYAAASAAALNSAPPTEAGGGRGGRGAADDDGTPGGAATATTPQSAGGSDYELEPQRDATYAIAHSATPSVGRAPRRNFFGTEPEIASIAAKIAAAAYAQNPGEAPETVAKRVAAAMSEALEAQKAPRALKQLGSPTLWDESDGNVDSSWAQALGALDNEWARSVVDIAPVPKATSPPRYAAGCDDDEDDEEEAQSVSTLAPPVRVPPDPEPASTRPEGARVGGGGWGKLDRSADTEMSLSLDGRSLAALANASFDVPTDEDEENDMFISDSDAEGSNAWEDFKTTVFTPTRAKTNPEPRTAAKTNPARSNKPTSKKGKPPAAPAFKARVERLAAKEQAKAAALEPLSPEDEAALAEERAKKRKEAAALRKKAAAFDRRNREHLKKLRATRKK